ncbi:MAG TPA: T9SS type A sorting domain-containing protein [Chitinispirillaceae bacterium]|nr:T9SS type A sorting domain-containing protein [Chitinispirillaceae bacterium]
MNNKVFFDSKSFFLQRVVLLVLVGGAFLIQGTKAAINETMPSSIPAEILDDWKAQGGTAAEIKASLPEEYAAKCDGTFESACHWRRVYRMKQFPQIQTIMFAKHHNIGGVAVGFWVNVGPSDVSDANFAAKGALCLQKFENYYSQHKEILTKTNMCVKDPCISLDGRKVCFAMSPGKNKGYLLYELKIDNPSSVKQLTFNPAGLTVSDFEPCYLPNGDIMFSSTRNFGVIDCGWQPTSNMFVMDSTGKYIRQLGYDQVHTCYPVLCPDGSVLYSRWEYNDRDISNIMGLFSMYPDGCRQTEVFGNQTTWPQNFVHGRPVPGNPNKFFAVACGHHGEYSGEVFIIDNHAATNGPEYCTMISPPRKTESRDKDEMALGGVLRNSEYPYPLNEEWYLVSYRDENKLPSFGSVSTNKYKIYLKNINGTSRELLAWSDQSLHRPVVVAPWKAIWGTDPVSIAKQANYNDSMGTFTMQDVYYGAGMKGVDKKSGVAKTLRVVKLRYRVSGACNSGVAGQVMGSKPSDVIFSAPNICPVSLWGASWDAKEVLGEAKIYPDGSAAFKVPARTPVYFQVLDSNGCSIAGMRSWSTLMPGEKFSCYGCHEDKCKAPPPSGVAMAGTPQTLDKPSGIEGQPFDYVKFVQPILDKHCVSCHGASHKSGFDLRGELVYNSRAKKSFARSYSSLLEGIGSARSNKAINIATIFSQPPQMPPYSYGSTKSGIIKNVLSGHNNVKLTATEIRILATWIDLEAPHAGTYDSYMQSADLQRYNSLEQTAQKWYDIEAQNIELLASTQLSNIIMPHKHSGEKMPAKTTHFSISYLPAAHTLVLKNTCQGNLMLVDLRGKVLSRCSLTDLQASNGEITVTLPSALSTGLYIIRFNGVNGVQQTKFSVTQL